MPLTIDFDQHRKYIKANRFKLELNTMAKTIDCSRSALARYMKKTGLQLTKKQRYSLMAKRNRLRTTASTREDNFIRKNYLTLPVKTIASKLNRGGTFVNKRLEVMELVIPKTIIEQRKKESRYQKGRTPENKGKKQTEFMSRDGIKASLATRFKKGNEPHNTKHNGAISVREHILKNGRRIPYKLIRMEKSKWKMLHVYNWEKKYGPVPEGFIIVFKNKNTLQCGIRNLKMVSRPEHMANNTIHRYPPELKQLIRLNSKLKKKIRHAKEQNLRS